MNRKDSASAEASARRSMRAVWLACLILSPAIPPCAAGAAPAAQEAPSYVVDLAARHQVIDHFGASDAWTFHKIGAWADANKNRVADLLYSADKGIGLTFCRFFVGGGINHKTIHDDWRTSDTFEVSEGVYDWTRLPNERWFLRAAKARGVRHFGMTFYSPPMRLTRNGLTNMGADKTSTTNLKPGGEESYAKCLTDILVHFRDNPQAEERIEFDRVFPINEPQWDWQAFQEGNRASNADIRRIFLAVIKRMQLAGLRTGIAGPESGSIQDMTRLDDKARAKWHADYGDYLRFLTADKEIARGLNGVITYHSYWSDHIPGQLVPNREQLGKAFAALPGWKLWQSEYCIMEKGRDLGIDSALRVARVIHCDMTLVGASSWQWWLAVSNENFKSGLLYTDYEKPGDPENVLPSKTFWALGNYSRFIRPGMQRVDIRGGKEDIQGLLASAYVDELHRRAVVVFVNMAETPKTVRVAIGRGGQASDFPFVVIPHVTSAHHDLEPGPAVDALKGVLVPARSVVTLVSEPRPGATVSPAPSAAP